MRVHEDAAPGSGRQSSTSASGGTVGPPGRHAHPNGAASDGATAHGATADGAGATADGAGATADGAGATADGAGATADGAGATADGAEPDDAIHDGGIRGRTFSERAAD